MLELADIVRAAGPAYGQAHAGSLGAAQRRALDDIAACRTAALGGTIARCEQCGAVQYHYHSCRNRHCPKCQEDRAQDWLARTRERLLPCDHYLLTFTLPSELRAVARAHPRVVYAALLREAAAAVQELAGDPQWVGGAAGILAVLHTWSRTLEYHPHAHLLVTAGGLAPDGTTWIKPGHARFLLRATRSRRASGNGCATLSAVLACWHPSTPASGDAAGPCTYSRLAPDSTPHSTCPATSIGWPSPISDWSGSRTGR